jgi:hypothetical protein
MFVLLTAVIRQSWYGVYFDCPGSAASAAFFSKHRSNFV